MQSAEILKWAKENGISYSMDQSRGYKQLSGSFLNVRRIGRFSPKY
jgi:hypothetical protein